MAHLSTIDLFGYWLGIFLTLCILSFLYKDNPFYKLGEHIFIGVSIGYVVTKQYFDVIQPKVVENIFVHGKWWYLFGLALAIALLMKLFRRTAWMGRFPIAFVVGFFAGLTINGVAQGDLAGQAKGAMQPLVLQKVDINRAPAADLRKLPGFSPSVVHAVIERRADRPFSSLDEVAALQNISDIQRDIVREARGHVEGLDAQASTKEGAGLYWFGTVNQILLFLGLLAGLIYFYFSVEQSGAVGKISRVGVWTLMIGFGASFGYTVQGRIALAIGRVQDVLGRDKDPHLAHEIHGAEVALVCLAIIVIGLFVWEVKTQGGEELERGGSSTER